MIQRCYSVYDLKAAAFAPPFFVVNDQVALRVMAGALADPTHPMSQHPADFVLHLIGQFDDEIGHFECLPEPKALQAAGAPSIPVEE